MKKKRKNWEAVYDAKLRELLVARNWEVAKCQIRARGHALDLFGWADFVAMGNIEGNETLVGIQNTSWGQRKKHIERYAGSEEIKRKIERWVACGCGAVMISWKRVKKKRGGKAFTYQAVIENLMELI